MTSSSRPSSAASAVRLSWAENVGMKSPMTSRRVPAIMAEVKRNSSGETGEP